LVSRVDTAVGPALVCGREVQAAVRAAQPDGDALIAAVETVTAAVLHNKLVWPGDIALFRMLAPHGRAAADAAVARWPDDYGQTRSASDLYGWLGHGLVEVGDWAEGLAVLEAGLALDERFDRRHEARALALDWAAEVYHALGNLDTALEYRLRALAWREEVLELLDRIHARSGDPVPVRRRAWLLLTRLQLPQTDDGIAEVYRDRGDPDTAADWQRKARAIWAQVPDLRNGDADPDHLCPAAAKKERRLGAGSPGTILPYQRLARAYRDRGDPAAARDALLKVLAAKEKALGPDHLGTALTYHHIAQVYDALGDKEAALTWFGQALRIRLDQAPDRRETAATLSAARPVHADLGRPEPFDDWLGI
jgi:tetratricopeptide (TPR) repeat protein